MNINIFYSTNTPIYQQICQQIQDAIKKGVLKQGDMLPSIRFLAKELKISVITTKRAYEELERLGYIFSVVGRGSFVCELNAQAQRKQDLQEISKKLTEVVAIADGSKIPLEEVSQLLTKLWKK